MAQKLMLLRAFLSCLKLYLYLKIEDQDENSVLRSNNLACCSRRWYVIYHVLLQHAKCLEKPIDIYFIYQ